MHIDRGHGGLLSGGASIAATFRFMKQRSRSVQLVVVAAVTASSALGSSGIVAALPELALEFDVGLAEIGILQTIVALPGVFLNPYVGMLADRAGTRRIVVVCLVLYGVFGMAGAFAPTFGLLLLSRFLMGAPYAALLVLTPNIVSRMFDGDERRRAIGLNSAALTASSTVGPAIGALLALGGAQRAFLIYAIGIPMAVVAVRLLPDDSIAADLRRPSSMRGSLGELRRGGNLGDLTGVVLYMLFFLTLFVGFGFVLAPVHLSELGVSLQERGPVLGAANLGSAMASLAFASGRVGAGRRKLLILGQVFATMGLLGLAVAAGPVGVGIAVLLLGLGMGTTYNSLQLIIAAITEPRHRGLALGIWSSAARLGQVIGGVLVAWLALGVGSTAAFAIGAASVVVVAVVLQPGRALLVARLDAGHVARPPQDPEVDRTGRDTDTDTVEKEEQL